MKHSFLVASLMVCGVVGCAANGKPAPTHSTLHGSLSTSSFSSAPTAVQAVDEGGRRVRSDIAKDGTFALTLGRGHRWSLEVVLPSGVEPIVFPRANNNVDVTFRVVGGGARVELGSVSHLGTPTVAAVTTTAMTCDTTDGNFEGDGDCENGVCTAAPTGAPEQADPSKPAAAAEHEVPEDVGGCEGGGGGED